jgi:hypothetical protein
MIYFNLRQRIFCLLLQTTGRIFLDTQLMSFENILIILRENTSDYYIQEDKARIRSPELYML